MIPKFHYISNQIRHGEFNNLNRKQTLMRYMKPEPVQYDTISTHSNARSVDTSRRLRFSLSQQRISVSSVVISEGQFYTMVKLFL